MSPVTWGLSEVPVQAATGGHASGCAVSGVGGEVRGSYYDEAASGEHMDVQGLCITGCHSLEIRGSTWESGVCNLTGQHSGTGSGGGGVGELAPRAREQEG